MPESCSPSLSALWPSTSDCGSAEHEFRKGDYSVNQDRYAHKIWICQTWQAGPGSIVVLGGLVWTLAGWRCAKFAHYTRAGTVCLLFCVLWGSDWVLTIHQDRDKIIWINHSGNGQDNDRSIHGHSDPGISADDHGEWFVCCNICKCLSLFLGFLGIWAKRSTQPLALAISQPASGPSSLLQVSTTVPTVVMNAFPTEHSPPPNVVIATQSKSGASSNVQVLSPSPRPCKCHCLCPVSAFQYGAMSAAPPIPTSSTFQPLPSLVTAGQPFPPLKTLTSLTASSSPVPAILSISVSDTAFSSSGPTTTPPQHTGGAPFDINTFSLLDAVTVALNIRDLNPTAPLY